MIPLYMSNVPDFFEIRIENTNSCGYKCLMCPREKHIRKIGFMSLTNFELILKRLEFVTGNYFHLHGFGEPLLDRLLPQKILFLKTAFPSAKTQIFSTLGVNLQPDYLKKLALSGLDHLVVSFYGFSRLSYKEVHGFDGFERAMSNLQLLSNTIKEIGSTLNIHVQIPEKTIYSSLPIAESEEKNEVVQQLTQWGCKIVKWQNVHNYGEGRSYNAPRHEKMCPVVNGRRRKILNITWELDVIPCCYDFNASIPFGNLKNNTLEEIFSSQAYADFLSAHKTGNLTNYPVCQNCEKIDVL